MSDESILGLLLRAHGLVSAQAHGEQYLHHNISASNCYENARQSIEAAIRQVGFADTYIARQDAQKKRESDA